MLDHLERRDHRKAQPLGQQVLGDADAVGDRQALPRRVRTRRIDRLAGRVHAEHVEAATRQRLRRQPGAAADVQQSQTRRSRKSPQRNPLDDPADPGRVHPVQRPHRPVGVPPARRQRVEPGDLVG